MAECKRLVQNVSTCMMRVLMVARSHQDPAGQPVYAVVEGPQPRQPGREGRPGRPEGGFRAGQRQGARPQQCAFLPERG